MASHERRRRHQITPGWGRGSIFDRPRLDASPNARGAIDRDEESEDGGYEDGIDPWDSISVRHLRDSRDRSRIERNTRREMPKVAESFEKRRRGDGCGYGSEHPHSHSHSRSHSHPHPHSHSRSGRTLREAKRGEEQLRDEEGGIIQEILPNTARSPTRKRPEKVEVTYVREKSPTRKREKEKETFVTVKPLGRSHSTTTTTTTHKIRSLDTFRPSRSDRPPLSKIPSSARTSMLSSRPASPTTIPHIRPATFLSIFNPPRIIPRDLASKPPERTISCLTCGSDDIAHSKSARLKCGHRMCHSCLRRIFRLSITDPVHMPPKCCTADHIPLRYVESLFSREFKIKWNEKFEEYQCKDRVYCSEKRCGAWIPPSDITKERVDVPGTRGRETVKRKVARCRKCRGKTCCECGGRWHGGGKCGRDGETKRLLKMGKEEGWKRCFSCGVMVELREGCNHMTCRCKAEFCMVCGSKWKTCNCPWFNYQAVEVDRLNHMRVPLDVPPLPPPPHIPADYAEETDARRGQIRQDEDLARRLNNTLGFEDFVAAFENRRSVRRDQEELPILPRPARALERERLTRYGGMAGVAASVAMNVPTRRPRGSDRLPVEDVTESSRGTTTRTTLPRTMHSDPLAATRSRQPYRNIIDEVSGPASELPRTLRMDRTTRAVHPRSESKRSKDTVFPGARSRTAKEARVAETTARRDFLPKSSQLAGIERGETGSDRVASWAGYVRPDVLPEEGLFNYRRVPR